MEKDVTVGAVVEEESTEQVGTFEDFKYEREPVPGVNPLLTDYLVAKGWMEVC